MNSLSQALEQCLSHNQSLPPHWQHLQSLAEGLYQDPKLQEKIKQHPQTLSKIAQNLAQFLLQQYQNLNPQKQTPIEHWYQLDLKYFFGPEYWPKLWEQMPSELQHRRHFAEGHQSKLSEKELEKLRQYLLDPWAEILNLRLQEQGIAEIDQARQKKLQELYKQFQYFEQLKDLIQDLNEDTGRLWDLSQGQLGPAAQLLKQNAWLEQSSLIQKLLELLGQLEKPKNKKKQDLKSAQNRAQDFSPASNREYLGLRQSNDIQTLLPSSLSLLAQTETENLFYRDLLHAKLLSWEINPPRQDQKGKDSLENRGETQGPIVLCLDTSGSMRGEPEQLAKALSLALLRLALKQKRACYIVLFSTKIKILNLEKIQENLNHLLNFLALSFYGGTDLQPALSQSLEILEQGAYRAADVLVVSDFVMNPLLKEIKTGIEAQQKQGTRFHALSIGQSGNPKVLACFDQTWPYDPQNPQALQDLIQKL